FNDWIFDQNRKPGDMDIVETVYGYHVMYFVSFAEEPVWQQRSSEQLANERFEEEMENFKESDEYAVDQNDFGMKFVMYK
ncbi:MAG TPA: hypothetical protein GX717_02175, partial [Clostridiaceae bacterium]|nr:hypothetical protein [Clostridiaceae bacterium]